MAQEHSHSQEVDLDKTDRLPILDGTFIDPDVADDAVPLDYSAGVPGSPLVAAPAVPPEFARLAGVDLPSLAESVRSVEERITRRDAEYEALTRSHEKTVAEKAAAAETARLRLDEAQRDAERQQGESRTLRASLAARDATIVQVLHSLGERDAQLTALQQEHAKIVPALEARSKLGTQLQADLQAARAQADGIALELKASREKATALGARIKVGDAQANAARSELGAVKTLANSYLEQLRTREWRGGFDLNLFREMDAKVGAADAGRSALGSERDRVQAQVTALETKIAAQQASLEAERVRMAAELAARETALKEALAARGGEVQRVAELSAAAERRQAEHAAQLTQLNADAENREQEMTVLMAHLQEARRPIQSIEAEVKRLTEELAAKSAGYEQLGEENRKLRTSLERTRGALEEREFLIRRLERSESNNANVLGRIQTSIERLGTSAAPTPPPARALVPAAAGEAATPRAEWSAEFERLDGGGETAVTHVLARRTRIGRAPGCELHIDSSSVSRHHALVLVGPRESIIEDLNSTNGVIVNGRRVTRQLLCDGDTITIGEVLFRYVARPLARAAEPQP